jgi:prevent-host-death family protein
METFNIRDLRNRTAELVRAAEHGHLSLVTKHGHPVFVAVPFDDTLLKSGVLVALAVGLVAEQKIGLAQAARIAGVSPSEMIDILAEHKVSLVSYSADELANELEQFKE